MGCGGSKGAAASPGGSSGGGASGGGGGNDKKGGDNQELLKEYTLGEVLGQGAFGVVYACCKKGTKDFGFAVKMVDKVETPVAEIKKEAEMMAELEHPNVVKFHNVYFEKCFVCIVMDRYNGGDLIEGMQLHWKSKGKIPCTKVIHIARQMALAIQHMHNKGFVHRDVKGDNYLTDRKDITDPDCKLYMSDFGTAFKLKNAQERLKSSCGTKIYWPPEFYAGNYGQKVDVWALGIIMYGLLDGRFPFKGEQDVRMKPIKLPSSAPPKCQEFVLKLLEKDEQKRYSSEQACAHPWISNGQPVQQEASADTGSGLDFDPNKDGMGLEGGANAGQDERRKELIERLENAAEGKKKTAAATQMGVLWAPRFDVQDKRTGKALRYEWWDEEKVRKEVGFDPSQASTSDTAEDASAQVETVRKQLEDHSIDVAKFGVGAYKTLEQFAAEVQNGAASLMLDAAQHKKLVRVVDVVLLRLYYKDKAGEKKYLTEFAETFADGRGRENLNRLPGTKKEPHENTKKTAFRIVKDFLNMENAEVVFSFETREIFEEEEESRSFPGVKTVYRKELVEGMVSTTDAKVLQQIGVSSPDQKFQFQDAKTKSTKVYQWKTKAECDGAKDSNGKPSPIKITAPVEGEEVSGLVQAPIGYGVDELTAFLQKNDVDIKVYGTQNAKTLKEFSNELIKGEASLMVGPDGKVVRIVDVVLIWLMKEGEATQTILVESQEKHSDGTVTPLKRLPGTKRRPDENHFVTAQRVLKRHLKMDENHVNLNAQKVRVLQEEKESPAFPGLRTLYRKRIIEATLLKPTN